MKYFPCGCRAGGDHQARGHPPAHGRLRDRHTRPSPDGGPAGGGWWREPGSHPDRAVRGEPGRLRRVLRRRAAQPLPHTPTPRRPQPQPQRPPPHPVAWHGHRRVLARAFGFLGPLEAAVPLALVPLGRGPPRLASRRAALAFAAIVAMQMANAFECHSARSSLWSIGPLSNRLLVGRWPSRRSPCSPSSACHPASRARSAGAYPAAVGPVLVAPWLLIAGEATRKALTRHRVRPHGARPKVPT